MSCQRFVILFCACLFLVLGLVGAFNRVVDPFWYYRDVEIAGFNSVKTKFSRFERHVKPAIVARDKPQALIFGRSFAEIGFDPLNAAFTHDGALAGYNFGLAGTSSEVVPCYLEYALAVTDIKRVVIGISPGQIPAVDCRRKLPDIGQIRYVTLLLSASAFKASLETVMGQEREQPSHTAAGLYFYTRGEPGTDRRFREFFQIRKQHEPACGLAAGRVGAPQSVSGEMAKFEVADSIDLGGLRQMVRLAVAREIELRIVAYPRHAHSLELDFLCGTAHRNWQALLQIADLIEREGGPGVQLWEFYGYNAVTGEPIASAPARYWQDPEHFNYEVGNVILNEMFGAPARAGLFNGRLGRRVTPSNVGASYRDFLLERNAFLRDNPWFYPALSDLFGMPVNVAR